MKHIDDAKLICRRFAIELILDFKLIAPKRVKELDAQDTMQKRQARRAGVSWILGPAAVRGNGPLLQRACWLVGLLSTTLPTPMQFD